MLTGQCSGSVHPNQPVCFSTADCRFIEMLVFSSVGQMCKSFFNGFICHRRDPQPLYRFMTVGFFQDPSGYQLSFPSRISGNNYFPDILSVQLGLHRLILLRSLTDYHKLHLLRHHRQCCHIPFLILFVIFFRVCQSHQMSQCPGNHVFVSFQCSSGRLAAVQYSCDIPSYRRIFCYDQ